MLDPSGVRDRYQQFAVMARQLLADFRQVEENFRTLDRRVREKLAGWQGSKGDLVDDVLGSPAAKPVPRSPTRDERPANSG
jgi:hypothetical protein